MTYIINISKNACFVISFSKNLNPRCQFFFKTLLHTERYRSPLFMRVRSNLLTIMDSNQSQSWILLQLLSSLIGYPALPGANFHQREQNPVVWLVYLTMTYIMWSKIANTSSTVNTSTTQTTKCKQVLQWIFLVRRG